ncbi:MAG: SDR family oxidoreductase [Cytophagales bacterium]|nr:SDR family oxidoreductase [Bernardetiaceae bacterium]MDW8209562.1 SDR family oxidoreductase [Cytophagales bacterium]
MLKGATIVVTGGAGFIGSHLCQRLLEEEAIVICLDNLSTGSLANIAHFANHPNFHFVEGDICQFSTCLKTFKGADYVLHQAALGSVPRSIEDPHTTNQVNVSGFLNVLEAARQVGVKRLVYASSSSVYGDLEESPKVESRTGNLLSPYAVSKYTNELYASVYQRLHQLPCIGLRYFNVFGKRQNPYGEYAAVVPRFINLLKEGKRPVIFGDGNQARDFTHVENAVQANIKALLAPYQATGKCYNIACGSSTSVNELFYAIRQAVALYDPRAIEIEPIYAAPRPGDIRFSLADITLAKKFLNYQPTHCLQRGLAETVPWFFHQEQK